MDQTMAELNKQLSPFRKKKEDKYFNRALVDLHDFFEQNSESVYYQNQLNILFEKEYFHWVTNRAILVLLQMGSIKSETRTIPSTKTEIKLIWHKSFRYYKRNATSLVDLVNEYSNPNIGAALGIHAELMVLEGFAKNQFVMKGRESKEFGRKKWTRSGHNLDFIFEKDTLAYGVEVKNTLSYMDPEEINIKIQLCNHLGITPVFVVRSLPKDWIFKIIKRGGFVLSLGYQLYPYTHKDLAEKVNRELGLPVSSPRALLDGTMKRFLDWHNKRV